MFESGTELNICSAMKEDIGVLPFQQSPTRKSIKVKLLTWWYIYLEGSIKICICLRTLN